MYCKKCGTEQVKGQRFCPKCGEPFIELNEKTEQTTSFVKEFINNPSKIGLTTKVVACLFALWFIVKMGFSASIIWYILLAAMLYVAFMGIPKVKLEDLKARYASAALCVGLLILLSFGLSKGGNNSSGFWGDGTKEICITMKADFSQGYEDISGNYGMVHAYAGYFTDEIIIPQGKMWTFKKQEIEYPEKGSTIFHPDICYYGTVNADVSPVIYNTYTQLREIPIFRGNDRIRIRVKSLTTGNGKIKQPMEAKVYFIEKDDDLQK